MSLSCRTCGAVNDAQAEACCRCGRSFYSLTEGAILNGRYEILRQVGRGGMGVVYSARDRELDETVAIKLLRADVATSPEMNRRFRSEIKLARRIRHPNVCAIHEYGQDGHLRYIIMEYVEGIDYKAILRRTGPFAVDDAIEVAVQVAEGLAAIHDAGIVHRDLKTPNLMRDAEGRVRLMDFGIAKQLAVDPDGHPGTATGVIVGTPEYMSPEQARSEAIDGRSDIYALGIVIYELVTGDVPFRGDTPLSTLMMQLETPPPLRSDRLSHLPRALVEVLEKCLAKERAHRYANMRELAAALRSVREPAMKAAGPTVPVLMGAAAPALVPAADAAASTPVPEPTAIVPRSPAPSRPGALPAARVPPERTVRLEQHRDTPTPARGPLILATLAAVVGAAAWSFWPAGRSEPPVTPAARPSAQAQRPPADLSPSLPAPALMASPAVPAPGRSPRGGTVDARGSRRENGIASNTVLAPRERARQSTPSPSADAPGSGSEATLPAVGTLRLIATPWAEVMVDGEPKGETPLILTLSAGVHSVRFSHPGYFPVVRSVTIGPGGTTRLDVDLAREASPR
jgi:serine/threonine-protein kinase